MSGGFFRGTSADQDTRFSNKQAKLLKSQKFAPELENLVDMTKVKMDVMRPWIAHRVTELLGFEDEVLINFIYGLLEEKVVNGKKIQISLTGFMEKNTGKFMKELWTHLLSAEKNASGVPQQFLDAKEEETRKNQADRDRIASELKRTKEKEGRELEEGRTKKMDGEADNVKDAAFETHSRSHTRVSSKRAADEKEANERDGSRGRTRMSISPYSADRSLSGPRVTHSRSTSKSFSNSRSSSRSRSLSSSPRGVQRSVSSERRRRSPLRRSSTPRRVDSPLRSSSPARRGSSHLRRYGSRSHHRSPSPPRRRLRSPPRHRSRTPMRRRSRSPLRRRSRSPIRRRSRSPVRRRSLSPIQRRSRSPIRRRSPSPIRRRSRSPFRRRSRIAMRYRSRSPLGRRSRSPLRRVSQSPMHRSPSSVRRRSPSPMRRRYRRSPSTPRRRSPSPVRRRTTFSGRRRSSSPGSMSPSPQGRISQSPTRRAPLSPLRRSPKHQQRSPVRSSRDRHRIVQEKSPVRAAPLKENAEQPHVGRKQSVPLGVRSPERDLKGRGSHDRGVPALSSSPSNSPSRSVSPPAVGRRSPNKKRSPIPPVRQREIVDSPDSAEVEETSFSRGTKDSKSHSLGKVITRSPTSDRNKDPYNDKHDKNKHSSERLASHYSREIQAQKKKSENDIGKRRHPESLEELPRTHRDILSNEKVQKFEKGYRADGMNNSLIDDVKGSPRQQGAEKIPKLPQKAERSDRSGSLDSGSEERVERRGDVSEKKKRKRSKRKDVTSDDDYSHDSQERKEAKRRRKQEKRLKREEKHRRREERRRRKEERRTEKLKLKTSGNVSPPSDLDDYASDGEQIAKREAIVTDNEQALSDEKKLEIELREKALQSLRAKKGIGH